MRYESILMEKLSALFHAPTPSAFFEEDEIEEVVVEEHETLESVEKTVKIETQGE